LRIAISLLNFRPSCVGGVETYLRQLLAHAGAARGGDEIVVVEHRGAAGALPAPGLQRAVLDLTDRAVVAHRVLEAFTPWRCLAAERLFKSIAADVVYFPQQSIFPKRVTGPCVLQALDVQHLVMPRYFSRFDRAFRACVYPRSLTRAGRVIAISDFTRRMLIERAGIPAGKVAAIPFGVTPPRPVSPGDSPKVQGPYLYFPAATFPHKGHATLFRSFAALRRRGGPDRKLVLTGQRTPHWRHLQGLIAGLGIAGDVLHLGFVAPEVVDNLYANAEAVVFPTEFEGFGLPVVEAIQRRKKIICSRLEVFAEIGVPPEAQIDFSDPDQLLAALNNDAPPALIRSPWTWAQAVEATIETLRALGAAGPEPVPTQA